MIRLGLTTAFQKVGDGTKQVLLYAAPGSNLVWTDAASPADGEPVMPLAAGDQLLLPAGVTPNVSGTGTLIYMIYP